MELLEILNKNIADTTLIYCVLASALEKDNKYKKITVKPIKIKDEIIYQIESFTEKQAFHENISTDEIVDRLMDLSLIFKNMNLFTVEADYQIMKSKKGKIKIIKSKPTKKQQILEHNKIKQYIIEENKPCDFLIELGVMTKDGKVHASYYDKFKQINKFLEIVDDVVSDNKLKNSYKIIDFGCGKAYLTFALYYYFRKLKNVNVDIVGLDLKTDVIDFCNEVSNKLGYDHLKFENGDIKDYNTNIDVDMVVTLHACNNATDAAIVKAILWNTDILLSVPCCQHEFYDKINNIHLEPMLKHGLIKERLSSMVTDSLRGLFLESKGYKVQMVEFVDMEHTPKNLLIRAVKQKQSNDIIKGNIIKENSIKNYEDFKKFWKLEDIFIENYYEKEREKFY